MVRAGHRICSDTAVVRVCRAPADRGPRAGAADAGGRDHRGAGVLAGRYGHDRRSGVSEEGQRPAGSVVRDPRGGHRAAGRHGLPGHRRGAGAERVGARAGLRAAGHARADGPGWSLLADQPDPGAARAAPVCAGRAPVRTGHARGPGPAGPLGAAGHGGRRGHLRQARAGAVHPPGSSPGRVHRRAEPPARRRGRGPLARDRAGAEVRTGSGGRRGVRQLRPGADRRRVDRPGPRGDARCPGPGSWSRYRRPDVSQTVDAGSGYHRAAGGPAGAQHQLGPGGRRGRAGRRVRRRPARGTRPAGRGAQHDLGGRRVGQRAAAASPSRCLTSRCAPPGCW